MSGIVGVSYLDGRPLDRGVLDQMVQSLAHRGPDGTRAWSEDGVGLGHQMLHTTPESLQEKLPLEDEHRSLVLTADARIDNRGELIRALGFTGLPEKEITDSELILGAYKKWGARCPERLLGDFAFAIWDRRRQVMFCARDHIGARPFYYHHKPGSHFVFGSEIKSLFRVPGVPRRFNEVMVADHLIGEAEDSVSTFFQEISRLPNSHAMTVDHKNVAAWRYWALDPSRELKLRSDGEYAEAFREIFTQAVGRRARSAFSVGADLSGGLDSSSVVCVARDIFAKEGNKRLSVFSSVPEHVAESDETDYLDAILDQGGLDAYRLWDERMSPLSNLHSILQHVDEPPFLVGAPFNWGMRGAAHDRGVRIVLTGMDGDVVVDETTNRLLELARGGRWIKLAEEIEGFSNVLGRSRWSLLRQLVIRPHVPDPVLHAWRTLRGAQQPVMPADLVLRPEFVRESGVWDRANSEPASPSGKLRFSRLHHWRYLSSGLWPRSLELHNGISAAFSVEDSHPFLDRRLMEFCLAIPPEQRLTGGYGRVVMRRALAGLLPEKVRWRYSKGNYSHTFTYGLLARDRRILEEAILTNSYLVEKYVDTDELRRTYHRFLIRAAPEDASFLVRVAYLVFWLRKEGLTP